MPNTEAGVILGLLPILGPELDNPILGPTYTDLILVTGITGLILDSARVFMGELPHSMVTGALPLIMGDIIIILYTTIMTITITITISKDIT
jgi:hypothetical protein